MPCSAGRELLTGHPARCCSICHDAPAVRSMQDPLPPAVKIPSLAASARRAVACRRQMAAELKELKDAAAFEAEAAVKREEGRRRREVPTLRLISTLNPTRSLAHQGSGLRCAARSRCCAGCAAVENHPLCSAPACTALPAWAGQPSRWGAQQPTPTSSGEGLTPPPSPQTTPRCAHAAHAAGGGAAGEEEPRGRVPGHAHRGRGRERGGLLEGQFLRRGRWARRAQAAAHQRQRAPPAPALHP